MIAKEKYCELLDFRNFNGLISLEGMHILVCEARGEALKKSHLFSCSLKYVFSFGLPFQKKTYVYKIILVIKRTCKGFCR